MGRKARLKRARKTAGSIVSHALWRMLSDQGKAPKDTPPPGVGDVSPMRDSRLVGREIHRQIGPARAARKAREASKPQGPAL